MKIMPLYHVKHFKNTETHTIGKFTSKERATEHARRFIKGLQENLEEKGIYTIVELTHFNKPDIKQDITMYTLTDAKHNPIGEHDSLLEGAIISLSVPTMTPETGSFFDTLNVPL
jgi:hypothetical protein